MMGSHDNLWVATTTVYQSSISAPCTRQGAIQSTQGRKASREGVSGRGVQLPRDCSYPWRNNFLISTSRRICSAMRTHKCQYKLEGTDTGGNGTMSSASSIMHASCSAHTVSWCAVNEEGLIMEPAVSVSYLAALWMPRWWFLTAVALIPAGAMACAFAISSQVSGYARTGSTTGPLTISGRLISYCDDPVVSSVAP